MPESRFVLTTRGGRAIRNPIDEDLRRALDEIFALRMTLSGLAAQAEHVERASASLRYEQGTGATLALGIRPDGSVQFDQWADPQGAATLSPSTHMEDVSFSHALALWRALRAGDVGAVKSEAWGADGPAPAPASGA